MAQIMSLTMTVFITVPMVAPALGQGILWFANWRAIFVVLLLLAVVVQIWFWIRQPETLVLERRTPFSARHLWQALREVCRNRIAMGYTFTVGLVLGAFLGYIISAQQILQEQYQTGDLFALYFAIVAASLGIASFMNSRLVMRFGMSFLTLLALKLLTAISIVFLGVALAFDGHPPFELLLAYLLIGFFHVGILLGNLQALAMEPLGHIAGMGAAVIGSISTFLSFTFATLLGQAYDGTIIPLVAGFVLFGGIALCVCFRVQQRN